MIQTEIFKQFRVTHPLIGHAKKFAQDIQNINFNTLNVYFTIIRLDLILVND